MCAGFLPIVPRWSSRGRRRAQWYALGGFGAKRDVTGAPSSRPPRSSQKCIAQCLLSLACMRLHSATRSSSASTTTPSAGWAVRGSYLQSSRATHRPRNSSLRQICGQVNRLPIRCSLSPLFSLCQRSVAGWPCSRRVRIPYLADRLAAPRPGVKQRPVAEQIH